MLSLRRLHSSPVYKRLRSISLKVIFVDINMSFACLFACHLIHRFYRNRMRQTVMANSNAYAQFSMAGKVI